MTERSQARKIEMDSIDDVYHLMNGIKSAYKKMLDEDQRSKPLDKQTQKLVDKKIDKWIKDVFVAAGGNIRVGGRNGKDLLETSSEPYDESLSRQADELEKEAKDRIVTVLKRRRTIPDQMDQLIQQEISRHSSFAENVSFESTNNDKQPHDHQLPFSLKELSKDYQDAMKLMVQLKKDVPTRLSTFQEIDNVVGRYGNTTNGNKTDPAPKKSTRPSQPTHAD